MKNIVEALKTMPDPIFGNGCTETDVALAEEALGIPFAKDYREYLLKVGVAAADGREFTGLGRVKRTNVVQITVDNRSHGSEALKSMYVVEETGFDGIVVWQNSKGEIFETRFGENPKLVADSFVAYLTE